eukprot:1555867-Amphidinium_carterae.1
MLCARDVLDQNWVVSRMGIVQRQLTSYQSGGRSTFQGCYHVQCCDVVALCGESCGSLSPFVVPMAKS